VSSPARPLTAQRPVALQRLWTKEEFKKQTDAGLLSGRGKTMKALDALLEEYHGIRKNGCTSSPAPPRTAPSTSSQIVEIIAVWKDTHGRDNPAARSASRLKLRPTQSGTKNSLRSATNLASEAGPAGRAHRKQAEDRDGGLLLDPAKLGPIQRRCSPPATPGDRVAIGVPVELSGRLLGFRVKARWSA
jgi:hypothetical protein